MRCDQLLSNTLPSLFTSLTRSCEYLSSSSLPRREKRKNRYVEASANEFSSYTQISEHSLKRPFLSFTDLVLLNSEFPGSLLNLVSVFLNLRQNDE